jgi:hypothetical protein
LDAQHVEIISTDLIAPQAHIPTPATAHVHGCKSVQREAAQNAIPVAIVLVIGIGKAGKLSLGGVHVKDTSSL